MSIYRFPKILVLNFKRFYNSRANRAKLTNSLEIPMNIDMTYFSSESLTENEDA
jgi:hypothetical protein